MSNGIGLHICGGCAAPFAVPVDLLEIVDEGRYLLAFQCASCGHIALGVHEDAELEELDRELDRTSEQIAAALRDSEHARLAEQADRFAAALHEGGILPEDF